MKKDFLNFFKKKRKRYAKSIFCYSLASVMILTQSFPSLALSTDESKTTETQDTISSVIDSVKNSTSSSESISKIKTKEIISSEDNTLKPGSTKIDSSTKSTENSKDDKNSEKDDSSSKDDNDSEKDDTSGDNDSKKDDTSSKNDNDSEKDNTSSKDDKVSEKDDSSSNKDDKVSEKDNTSSKDDTDSEKDNTSSKDDNDSTADTEASTSTAESSTTENVNETEVYETIEDIEIATEDPSEYDDNELLVQFKTNVNEKRVQEITTNLPETTLKSYSDGIAVFSCKSQSIVEENIAILSTIQEVSIIQPNYKYSFASAQEGEEMEDTIAISPFPNDTFFSKQWGLYNKNSSTSNIDTTSSNRVDIDVLGAWQNFHSDNEVIVAVIDTGVDYQHKDLKDHMWLNKAELDGIDGIDDDNNGYIDDLYGWDFYNDDASICHYSGTSASKKDNDNHGTRCAGIIAATANNNFGIAGVASNVNVKIMSLKTAGGPNAEGDTANIIKAIKYASYNGAKICNASWNCENDDPALKLAISESNMLFVCSAGNGYGTNIDNEPSYPCSYKLNNIVGVTSIDPDGTLSYFSNYGKNTVSMAAPGSDICSTIVGKYGYDSGTSMATPFVTGVAAMLYAYDSTLYPARAKSILLSSTKTLSPLKNKVTTNGIINAALAVSNVQEKTYEEDKIPPTIASTVIPRKNGAYLSINVKDEGGSYTRVQRYAYGKLPASSFKNGSKGKSLAPGTKPFVTTQGYYTIYAQDNAGNEAIKVIKVSFDKTAPSLSLSYKKYEKKYQVTIKASDSASGLSEVRYAKSKHSASYMKSKGTKLSSFNNTKTITISSEGVYTFYAKDKAGNSVVKTITLDKTAPSLSLSYKRYGGKYKITIKASDSGSGLSEVRYARHKHSTAYMKSKGKKLGTFTSKTKTITVSSKGTYTFYAKDKAGNTIIKTVQIK